MEKCGGAPHWNRGRIAGVVHGKPVRYPQRLCAASAVQGAAEFYKNAGHRGAVEGYIYKLYPRHEGICNCLCVGLCPWNGAGPAACGGGRPGGAHAALQEVPAACGENANEKERNV